MKRKTVRNKNALLASFAAILAGVMLTSCSGAGTDTEQTTESETEQETTETTTEVTTTVTGSETVRATPVPTEPAVTETQETSETSGSSEETSFTLNIDYHDIGKEYTLNEEHGSAVTLEGRVLIVSIFASDSYSSWDFSKSKDINTRKIAKDKMGVATEFLTEQADHYGKEVIFIYDWDENEDLYYTAGFDHDISNLEPGWYALQDNWINDNVNTLDLLKKYRADNLLFMFYFNTGYECESHSCAIEHKMGDYIINEYVNINMRHNGYEMTTASFAHEIIHTFGAPDLYYASEWIPQEYVDELMATNSNDIMYTVSTSYEIVNDFTDLDAYYVGIAERPEIVDEWSLSLSEHDLSY
ncbi:hypothetical protein [Butyrivibrio sp. AE2032]|uniref:hypothetical protein n=1 Tax=Butyrivibrio sp. AE2032 TaxID=1458463 RepID=UPI0005521AC7|nr:hypothetical protein [Butyrivibrio sp. AE2032]